MSTYILAKLSGYTQENYVQYNVVQHFYMDENILNFTSQSSEYSDVMVI